MEIKSKNELEQIIKENKEKLVALRFHASWCAPCKVLGDVIDELNLEDVLFVGADVDEAEESFASENNVLGVPTVLFYKNGNVVDRFTGMIGKDALLNKINEIKSK